MNIQYKIMKDKILCLEEHHTLGASNRQFSSKGGGWEFHAVMRS